MRSLFTIFLIPTLLAWSPVASALPDLDFPLLGTELKRAYQNAKIQLEKSEMYDAISNLSSELSKLEISNINNGAANYSARQGAARQEINDRDLAMKMEPAFALCQSVAYSFSSSEIGCESQDRHQNEAFSFSTSIPALGASTEKTRQITKDLAEQIEISNPELFVDDPESLKGADIGDSPSVLDPSDLLSSSPESLSIEEDREEALRTMVRILTPNLDSPTLNLEMPTSDKDLSTLIGLELRTLSARQSLMSLIELRSQSEGGGPSKLSTYQSFIDEYTSPSVVEAFGNGNITTPYSLKRSQLIINMNKAKVQLDQFKSELRNEHLNALKLIELSEMQPSDMMN